MHAGRRTTPPPQRRRERHRMTDFFRADLTGSRVPRPNLGGSQLLTCGSADTSRVAFVAIPSGVPDSGVALGPWVVVDDEAVTA